jgi:RNA-directed DNA polymerase
VTKRGRRREGVGDNVRHHILLAKVARRIEDRDVMRLLKLILKAGGSKGVPQGGVISPLLSNIYLNEIDPMLERARRQTRERGRTCIAYARYDDLVVLVDGQPQNEWLQRKVDRRPREERLGTLRFDLTAACGLLRPKHRARLFGDEL